MPSSRSRLTVPLLAFAVALPAARADLSYETAWVGNTYPASNLTGVAAIDRLYGRHMVMDVQGIFVDADGTVFTNAEYGEGRRQAIVLDANGDMLHFISDHNARSLFGGSAVTADDNYAYRVVEQRYHSTLAGKTNSNGLAYGPGQGTIWYAVRRNHRNGNYDATIPGGYGFDGSLLVVNTTGNLLGLAVDATRLYVSDTPNDQVLVYDKTSFDLVATYSSIDDPRHLAVDDEGKLWVSEFGTNRLLRYDPPNGGAPGYQITAVNLPSGTVVTGLAFNPAAGQVLVADNGVNQNVRIYNKNGSSAGTFGTAGGVFAGTGATIGTAGPGRFVGLTGVGADSGGNLYVGINGRGPDLPGHGGQVEKYQPNGQRLWQVCGLEFVDSADWDPADQTALYTVDTKYRLDYSKPAGQQWTIEAYTYNPFKYPNDNRRVKHLSSLRRLPGGQLLMTANEMSSETFSIYRFDSSSDGEVAIPAVILDRQNKTLWVDDDGDGEVDAGESDAKLIAGVGTFLDDNGDIWLSSRDFGYRHLPMIELNAHGVPVYELANQVQYAVPSPMTDIRRAEYDADSDTLYLTGYSSAHPKPSEIGNYNRQIGAVILRVPNWSQGNRDVEPNWQVVPPVQAELDHAAAFEVEGDYIFVQYSKQPMRTRIYRKSDGVEITSDQTMLKPWGEDFPTIVDIPYGMRARHRSDGKYSIVVENDGYISLFLYHWDPLTTAPPVPRDVAATPNSSLSDRSILVTWTAAPGASGYQLQRQKLTAQNWEPWQSVGETLPGNADEFLDAIVAPDTRYAYRVRSVGPGPSSYSKLAVTRTAPATYDGLPIHEITASADDGNVPANTLDDDLGTRWSANGQGQWIRYDLGETKTVTGVGLAWHSGNTRTAYFDVEVSDDGDIWTTALSAAQSSGTTLDIEQHNLTTPAQARYVRIVGQGNSSNNWNSITETHIYGDAGTGGGGQDQLAGDVGDAERQGGTGSAGGLTSGGSDTLLAGRYTGAGAAKRNPIFVFDLSGVTGAVQDAELKLYFQGKLNSPGYEADLYAVGYASSPTPSHVGYYADTNPDTASGVTLLADDFVTSATTDGQYLSVSGSTLVNYLNNRPGGQDYVFFRLSPDGTPSQETGYLFSSADHANSAQKPVLIVE